MDNFAIHIYKQSFYQKNVVVYLVTCITPVCVIDIVTENRVLIQCINRLQNNILLTHGPYLNTFLNESQTIIYRCWVPRRELQLLLK